MKKTTIQVSEETKTLMVDLIRWTNVLLNLLSKNSDGVDYGKVDSYDDLLLNYVFSTYYESIKELLRKYIPNIDDLMYEKFVKLF